MKLLLGMNCSWSDMLLCNGSNINTGVVTPSKPHNIAMEADYAMLQAREGLLKYREMKLIQPTYC